MIVFESDLSEVISRAVGGEERAWQVLVGRVSAGIFGVIRPYRLTEADAHDVHQETLMILLSRLATVREPPRLAGWLATVARRQALRVVLSRCSEPSEIENLYVEVAEFPEAILLRKERNQALWRVVAQLPARQQELVYLMAHHPHLSYVEIAVLLGVQPGSVGPLRRRCLDRLRRRLLADGFSSG